MPDANGMPTEAEWLEGRYPGAQEEYEASLEPLGTCIVHGDYWSEDCYLCYPSVVPAALPTSDGMRRDDGHA